MGVASLTKTKRAAWRVGNGVAPSKIEIYRVLLAERLPIIRVSLRKADVDAPLDLQLLVDACYRNRDYEYTIDYRAGTGAIA
jgi:hypothetical protein